jgi:hypothetical protein
MYFCVKSYHRPPPDPSINHLVGTRAVASTAPTVWEAMDLDRAEYVFSRCLKQRLYRNVFPSFCLWNRRHGIDYHLKFIAERLLEFIDEFAVIEL